MKRIGLPLLTVVACLAWAGSAFGVPLPQFLRDRVRTGPVRVVVVDLTPVGAKQSSQQGIVQRLKKLNFEVDLVHFTKIDPSQAKRADVILLATMWGDDADPPFRHLESIKDAFHSFVRQGGGLLVCQPNPTKQNVCTPTLLPYPITFQNHYDKRDPTRINLAPDHFITRKLPDDAMPFPSDPMLKLDPRYQVLARQKSTGFASLAVCSFGAGRVVVQTANENVASNIPIGDEILRRMVVWAARRDTPRDQNE